MLIFNLHDNDMQPSTSGTSGTSKRAKPYSLEELIDIRNLHRDLGIGNYKGKGNKSAPLWVKLNDICNSKHGERKLSARQWQYHNKIKDLKDGELELHKNKSKETGHYEFFSAEEMLDIKSLYTEFKIDEVSDKVEKGRRWPLINEILNQRYIKRDDRSRKLKYHSFIKNKTEEELSGYAYVHPKSSGVVIDFSFQEKRMVKELVEQFIFDKNGPDYNNLIKEFKQINSESLFNGENSSILSNSFINRLNLVNWDNITDQVNAKFNNNRNADNLKRYYTRVLLRYDSVEQLEMVTQNKYTKEQNALIFKTFEESYRTTGKYQNDKIQKLFPNCKPMALYKQYRWLTNKKSMKLNENDEIEIVPQLDFHYNSMGPVDNRPLIKQILKSFDDGVQLVEVAEKVQKPIKYVRDR